MLPPLALLVKTGTKPLLRRHLRREKAIVYASTDNLEDKHLLRSVLNGTVLGGVAYGTLPDAFTLLFFFECMHLLVFRSKESIKWHLVIFVSVNFILGSVQFGTQMKFTEIIFVDNSEGPGGSLGVYLNNDGYVWNALTSSALSVSNWITDALLIYRLFMFWSNSRGWKVIAFPCLALSGSIVLGTLLLVKISRPTEPFWDFLAVRLGSSYGALTITINVYVTALIVGRIIFLKHRINQLLSSSSPHQAAGHSKTWSLFKFRKISNNERPRDSSNAEQPRPDHSVLQNSLWKRNRDPISSATSMLLESAALFTITSMIFEGMYARRNALRNLFMPIMGQTGAISALLIIVRVARGTAWTRNDVVEISSIRFS
ncbi:hypothetical protein ACEPAI_9713 [Sanghuangporus weigelae]